MFSKIQRFTNILFKPMIVYNDKTCRLYNYALPRHVKERLGKDPKEGTEVHLT